MDLSPYILEICKLLRQKCLRFTRIADLFHAGQNNYDLRHVSYFAIPNVKSVYYGTKSLSNLGPRICNLVPDKLKQLVDIHAFKKEIKKWKPENCPCRLCKTYIPRVGFI